MHVVMKEGVQGSGQLLELDGSLARVSETKIKRILAGIDINGMKKWSIWD